MCVIVDDRKQLGPPLDFQISLRAAWNWCSPLITFCSPTFSVCAQAAAARYGVAYVVLSPRNLKGDSAQFLIVVNQVEAGEAVSIMYIARVVIAFVQAERDNLPLNFSTTLRQLFHRPGWIITIPSFAVFSRIYFSNVAVISSILLIEVEMVLVNMSRIIEILG